MQKVCGIDVRDVLETCGDVAFECHCDHVGAFPRRLVKGQSASANLANRQSEAKCLGLTILVKSCQNEVTK